MQNPEYIGKHESHGENGNPVENNNGEYIGKHEKSYPFDSLAENSDYIGKHESSFESLAENPPAFARDMIEQDNNEISVAEDNPVEAVVKEESTIGEIEEGASMPESSFDSLAEASPISIDGAPEQEGSIDNPEKETTESIVNRRETRGYEHLNERDVATFIKLIDAQKSNGERAFAMLQGSRSAEEARVIVEMTRGMINKSTIFLGMMHDAQNLGELEARERAYRSDMREAIGHSLQSAYEIRKKAATLPGKMANVLFVDSRQIENYMSRALAIIDR